MDSKKKCFAEFLGTFALVFAGTGAIVINDISGGAITHVGIALTIPDPLGFQGTPEERLAFTRKVRDAIKTKVEQWCAEICTEVSC